MRIAFLIALGVCVATSSCSRDPIEEPPGECSGDEKRCDGSTLQACSGGDWSTVQNCAAEGLLCSEQGCTPGLPDAEQPDTTETSGDPGGSEGPDANEQCNGQDDDDDGQTDEGFDVGAPCSAGTDDCAATGKRICAGDGLGTVCDAVALNGVPCDDGDACTKGDLCNAGACVGAVDDCDDGNGCTTDSCGEAGCEHADNSEPCDDGEACTVFDVCEAGQCAGTTPDCCDACCLAFGAACAEGFTCVGEGDKARCQGEQEEVYVAGGFFGMGCRADDSKCGPDEKPYHLVKVSAFAIDRVEVRANSFAPCVAADACTEPGGGTSSYATFNAKPEAAVNFVSWKQALSYCQWAGKRLCTEAEWEMAARGSCWTQGCAPGESDCCEAKMRLFPWGDDPPTCELAVMLEGAWACDTDEVAEGGSKPAGHSIYGALDMAGNLWEWVNDVYAKDYYCHGPESASAGYCGDAPPYVVPWINPQGPPPPATTAAKRVQKGGSLASKATDLRASGRFSGATGHQGAGVGFRCCRSLP